MQKIAGSRLGYTKYLKNGISCIQYYEDETRGLLDETLKHGSVYGCLTPSTIKNQIALSKAPPPQDPSYRTDVLTARLGRRQMMNIFFSLISCHLSLMLVFIFFNNDSCICLKSCLSGFGLSDTLDPPHH